MGVRIKKSGVYQIVNEVNGKCYIGSSKDIRNRWNHWRDCLRKKIAYKSLFKLAVQKYGIENFTFILLEECEPTKQALESLENHYFDLLRPAYNILRKAYSPIGRKHPHTEITKAKIRAKRALQVMARGRVGWNRGYKYPGPSLILGRRLPEERKAKISAALIGHAVSEATRARIGASKKGNTNRRGKTLSEATRRQISASLMGKTHSDDTRRKMRESNTRPMLGRVHTEESRRKIREARAKQIVTPESIQKGIETKRAKAKAKVKA